MKSAPIELAATSFKEERKLKMDAEAKKTALRMIPYGLYVLTAEGKDGKVAASTVNWVTQTAFQPPLVVVGVKADSGAHAIIKESKTFALNILGKDQKDLAFTFFKTLEREGDKIGGQTFRKGSLGAPVLENAPAFVECKLVETIEKGDHSIFVGEVQDAGVKTQPSGRADDITLTLKDLGEKVFYGG
jgi:flavin reductase (DIM6/NTAB) family NADH-FMN oxidoreductase RutF